MIHDFTLRNGLRVVIQSDRDSDQAYSGGVVAIQLWVRVGSLDEGPAERGMAHFIEHMLFKGGARFGVGEMARVIESRGGDLNAYTSFEQTVIHVSVPTAGAGIALAAIADAGFRAAFDPTEVDRERAVIIEEIKRGLDNPAQVVGQKAFSLLYPESEAGRPIIGTEQSVAGFSRDDLFAFYQRHYRPEKMSLILAGDVEQDLIDQARQIFENQSASPDPARSARLAPELSTPSSGFTCEILRGDYQQPRMTLLCPGPALGTADAAALDAVAFALTGGELGRWNTGLRDQQQLVTAIHTSLYCLSFGGGFEVSALCESSQLVTAFASIVSSLEELCGSHPVDSDELARARSNLVAERVHREETADGRARSLGHAVGSGDGLLLDDLWQARFNALTPEIVRSASARWLDPSQLWFSGKLVVMVPESETKLETDALKSQFHEIITKCQRQGSKASNTARPAQRPTLDKSEDVQSISISERVTLIHQYNPRARMVAMTAATLGGLRLETERDAGIHHLLGSLLGYATENQDTSAFLQAIESSGAVLSGFSGKDSLGIHFQCLDSEFERLLPLFFDSLLMPKFPEPQWDSVKSEMAASLRAQRDSAAASCMQRFQEMIFGNHPYRYPVVGSETSLAGLDLSALHAYYRVRRDAGPWVIGFSGPVPAEVISQKVDSALSALVSVPKGGSSGQQQLAPSDQNPAFGKDWIDHDREQAHLVYGFPGLSWSDDRRATMDVMANILGGHSGRLFVELRDKQGLAYSLSPILLYGCDPGFFGAYLACAPEKFEQAHRGIREELEQLALRAPAAEELSRAQAFIVGQHEMGLQQSDSRTSTMALMELYGCGYDDYKTYPDRIKAVSSADISECCSIMCTFEKSVSVGSGPRTGNY